MKKNPNMENIYRSRMRLMPKPIDNPRATWSDGFFCRLTNKLAECQAKNAHKLLLLFCLCQAFLGMAQNTPAVTTILPIGNSAYPPVFSPFCDQVCWLDGHAYDIPAQRFLSSDSTLACLPENARHLRFGFDKQYPVYLWWEADPFDNNYCWAHDYREDTLVLWRYNRELARQDSFVSLFKGYEVAVGKPGIWVSNHQELVLLDRHTGAERNRAGKAQEGMLMYLRPWGEDVLICDKWLYQREWDRYVPFFPLPTDMEDCKSPMKIDFLDGICISSVIGDNNKIVQYISAPDHPSIQIPFVPDWRTKRYDLGANAPFAWFSFPGKLVAFNYSTGASLTYAGETGEPLIGDQNGRFLGFKSERGMSFFDKYSCQFKILNLPYGFESPRGFTADHHYIYLTYMDHWEIIQFEGLDSAFHRSQTLEEFASFEKDCLALQKTIEKDFYVQYGEYLKIAHQYKQSKNPKIQAELVQMADRLGYPLFSAPDSTMERVAADYQAGRFDPSVSCEVVQALFLYWSVKNDLSKALGLTKTTENATCIEEYFDGVGPYYFGIVKTAQHRLDSVAQLKLQPDERLYALGKVWLDYRSLIWGINPFRDHQERFALPYQYFNTLIQQYPNSPWADNAAYDTMQLIDYHSQSTDDFNLEGDDNQAYRAFTQFLKDYPNSERRPDVLLRLAIVVQRGSVHDNRFNIVDAGDASEYLQILAQEYPEFAKNSKSYQTVAAQVSQQAWSEKWAVSIFLNQQKYKIQDTIRVHIRLKNKTQTDQTLDADFIQTWHEGQQLHLNEERSKDCEGLWGDFPLTRGKTPAEAKSVTIKAGDYYEEIFLLSHDSTYSGKFKLSPNRNYSYSLELRHNKLNWHWIPAQNRGKFSME